MAIGSPKVRVPKDPVKKGDKVNIKTMIQHPMESGLRKDKATGEVVPAHFITSVKAVYDGKLVLDAVWTGAVSKNPFLGFHLRAEKTGPVEVTWKDDKGEEFKASEVITVA
ncbi:MAG: thiosulfate oxidation carrier complex protein SoxZ [Magnetococcales bacterium]|nr:thiosulfate oxidation carrier complex protein SoxZ [Magnetococcales bacterium]MBF0605354.1 thiosulfate oxidation carrier complex protein SoxZ [Magnetococcales bacterium]HAT51196.1 thiosulfate oxidation carrier complex protein SoxZ [Alphaproteobacteria bacterium]